MFALCGSRVLAGIVTLICWPLENGIPAVKVPSATAAVICWLVVRSAWATPVTASTTEDATSTVAPSASADRHPLRASTQRLLLLTARYPPWSNGHVRSSGAAGRRPNPDGPAPPSQGNVW